MRHHFILVLSFFLLVACSNNKDNNKQMDNEEIKTSIQRQEEDAEDSLTQQDADLKSVFIINEEDAKAFAKSYNRIIRSRALGNYDRTSAIWFDKEVIKRLYDALYVEPKKDRLDGVRFYFGRYPKNYEVSSRAKKLTMFMLLTVPGAGDKTHNDTFYFKSERPLKWDLNKMKDIHNLNHGELCPEVCDGVYDFRNQY